MPRISIVMPTYNAEKYLREAIDSIMNQTFTDFEFLIVDDNSTDETIKIIKAYRDKRIRLIQGDCKGIASALNKGIKEAKGEYIARMDADDISLPERLEKQVHFMDNHTEIGILGCMVNTLRFEGGVWKVSNNNTWQHLKQTPGMFDMLLKAVFCHPSVMFRKSIIDKYNLYYNELFCQTEDQELWFRACKYTKFYNLNEVLFLYREHNEAASKVTAKKGKEILNNLRIDFLKWLNPNIDYKAEEMLTQIQNMNTTLEKPNVKLYVPQKVSIKTVFLFNFIPLFKIKKSTKAHEYYLFSFIKIFDIIQKSSCKKYRLCGIPLFIERCKPIEFPRIDFYLAGDEDNCMNILSPNISRYAKFNQPYYYFSPSWKKNKGVGYVLEPYRRPWFYTSFDLCFKVKKDCNIEISLKSSDMQKKYKYTGYFYKKIKINGQLILNKSKRVYHDKAYSLIYAAKKDEIITVSFKYRRKWI